MNDQGLTLKSLISLSAVIFLFAGSAWLLSSTNNTPFLLT